MGSEVTRASDADRQLYVDHLAYLFSEGYIQNRTEADQLRSQILEARSLQVLNAALSGMPLPPLPDQRRDWGIPERWVPVTIGTAVLGVLIAVVPTAALAHSGDSASNALTAAFFAIGIAMAVISIIASILFWTSWDNAGETARARRRSMDRNRTAYKDRDR